MHTDETADFLSWFNPSVQDNSECKTSEVKEESQTDFSLLPFSPPSSPFIMNSSTTSTRRITKSESPRTRPYPELHRSEDTIGMAGTSDSVYETWSRSRGSNDRRSSDGDSPAYQTVTYDPSSTRHMVHLSRSSSTSSSSLSGAVGAGPSSRLVSMSPRLSGHSLTSMGWHQSQVPLTPATPDLSLYPGVPGDVSYPFPNDTHYEGYPSTYPYEETTHGAEYTPTSMIDSPTHFQSLASENEDLRQALAKLEQQRRHDREQITALHSQLASLSSNPSGSSSNASGSNSFEASWRARTDARIRQYCSLNRAGNALCAWHDSRRERRKFPPRMAPYGFLNCGCTHEQALFEESLARHNVGSYLPGDNVRMDPALRNPLLQLLQERYNYRDGDFERDPTTGNWQPGEGPAYWEQQAATGINPRRPTRGDQHR